VLWEPKRVKYVKGIVPPRLRSLQGESMMQVVQASCPKCRSMLRIPADWIGRPMRCKRCRETFLSPLRESIQIQPLRPSAPARLPPSAVSAGLLPNPVPADAFAFDDDVDLGPATPLRSVRRGGGGWKRGVLLLGCVAAVATAVFFVARPHLA